MSDITKAVRTRLLGSANISTLVGVRIYPDILPQKDGKITVDLPAITVDVVSGSSESDLTGGIGLGTQRVSITTYAKSRSATRELSELIRARMLSMRGSVGTEHIRSVTCESRVDIMDPPLDASDQWRYLTAMDFEVMHGETVAAIS